MISIPDIELTGTELLLRALEATWRAYKTELKRCQRELSRESLFDLRVATRRILALIELLYSIFPRPRLEKMVRSFKAQLDEFDDLRDTQVILAEISEVLQEFPELQDFQKHQLFVENKALRALRNKIKGFNSKELARRIQKTHDVIATRLHPESDAQILQAVDDAYIMATQRLDWVDTVRPATIQRFLITFTSFHSMLEFVHPLLLDYQRENLQRMNDYQALMSEIHDIDLFLQTLSDYTEYSSIPDLDFAAVRVYYERRHAESVLAFVEGMSQFHMFWRSAPDHPFPWEKKTL